MFMADFDIEILAELKKLEEKYIAEKEKALDMIEKKMRERINKLSEDVNTSSDMLELIKVVPKCFKRELFERYLKMLDKGENKNFGDILMDYAKTME